MLKAFPSRHIQHYFIEKEGTQKQLVVHERNILFPNHKNIVNIHVLDNSTNILVELELSRRETNKIYFQIRKSNH